MKELLTTFGFLFFSMAIVSAEDWTTRDGKVYAGVQVVKVEDDALTIIYQDGGALIPLDKLPAALQQKYHYDPAKAQVAAAARAQADAENAARLKKEMDLAEKLKQKQMVSEASQISGNKPTAAH